MSQSSAQRILKMYESANTQRINEALELAMMEAQQRQLSEQATRKLLQETLQTEQKALNDYIAVLQKARTAQRRGQYDLARANISEYNKKVAQYERDKEQYDREAQRLRGKNEQAFIKAEQDAAETFESDAREMSKYSELVEELGRRIAQGDATEGQIYALLADPRYKFSADLRTSANRYNAREFATEPMKDAQGNTIPSEQTGAYKTSHLVNKILEDVAIRGGVGLDDPNINAIREFIVNPNNPSGQGGVYANLSLYEMDEIEDRRLAYEEDLKAKRRLTPTMKKPVPPSAQTIATQSDAEKRLINEAMPVLDALRDDYQITEDERRGISQTAFKAYEELKDVARVNPNAVSLDQQVLLSDIALQRALAEQQTKRKLAAPMAKPQSIEVTRARAVELAEPRRAEQSRQAMAEQPAYAQKYYASERKALELSDQDDEYVRTLGTPENYGVTKWKEVWNGSQMSSDYGTIVSEIEQQFPQPEDQLKALAAFNSRAMALQRAKSPILVEGGKLSEDYKAALEAMTPKDK